MLLFVFLSFLIWRISLFLISYFGTFIMEFRPSFPYADIFLLPSGLPSWIWSFANFDGIHYLTIAQKSYSFQFTQVFFPFFPLLLYFIQKIFYFAPPLLVAVSFSNLLFLLAMLVFYKLLEFDYSLNQIKWIIIFILIFPTSFYFGSLYTESLFILLAFLSFYYVRKKRWILASLFAALSSATRFVGIFLLPALLYEWYKSQSHPERSREIYFLKSPVIYIAPLGLIFYMVYLQLVFGDALYFWHAQGVFGAERSGSAVILLPQVFWRYLKILASVPVFRLPFWTALTEITATVSGIFLLIIAQRQKIWVSYLIYAWPSLILPTLTGTLSSMPRYILIIFPIFIALGLIQSKLLKILLLLIFSSLLVIFTLLFTRGYWVA